MIEAIELTSTRRSRGAAGGPVEKVSFDVYPGQVTALLGAPGAGKSTVLRLMVELEPGGGRTLFGGRPYRALRPAVREVGVALNPDAVHPGRTAQAHLQLYAAGGGVPKPRVAEVLEVAGLSTHATVRCGRLDPSQRQRLAIAAALLGDPAALILDEPHALDTHGMSWFHALIRAYAAQGRTVLVAVTDPDTLSGTADHVVVLRRDEQDGISRVIASRSAAEVFDERRATVVQVRSPQAARLAAALEGEGARLAPAGPGALQVRGLDRARIGEVAHVAGVCLHELSEIGHDDDVFGLRPVPRQKELLPALNRAGVTWQSGVRLVAEEIEEIEEAEVVEAAAEASAEASGEAHGEAEQPATAGAGAQAAEAGGAPQVGGGAPASASANVAVPASASANVNAPAGAPGGVGAPANASANVGAPADASANVRVPASASVNMGLAASASANVGAQALQNPMADVGPVAQAGEVPEAVLSQGSAGASIGAQTWQEPQGSASAEGDQRVRTAGEKSSVAGSWRTQGSVAGSRWSAVKGSQKPQGSGDRQPGEIGSTAITQEPVAGIAAPTASGPTDTPEPAPGLAATSVTASAKNTDQPAAPQSPAAASRTEAPTRAKSREVTRRTTSFGLRWGRSKPPAHAAPVPASASVSALAPVPAKAPASESVAAPALTQPAVPFTVAPSAVEQGAAEDGMTPWRAAAARASQQGQQSQQSQQSQQGQQQASVAEAAPAEQETSA